MIVVAIIGLLAAIAIPNFVKARATAQKNACIANLKQIQGATQVWAIDNNKTGSDTPATLSTLNTADSLVPNYIKKEPKCPAGGNYATGTVDAGPTCDYGNNHNL